jgi:hypothetical protein
MEGSEDRQPVEDDLTDALQRLPELTSAGTGDIHVLPSHRQEG